VGDAAIAEPGNSSAAKARADTSRRMEARGIGGTPLLEIRGLSVAKSRHRSKRTNPPGSRPLVRRKVYINLGSLQGDL